jgi:hypothetical protein
MESIEAFMAERITRPPILGSVNDPASPSWSRPAGAATVWAPSSWSGWRTRPPPAA